MKKFKQRKIRTSQQAFEKKRIFDKVELKFLLLICSLGFVLRLIFVLEMNDSPFFQNLFTDSKIYHQWGLEIANGDWIGNRVFFMAPFYPYFLGVIYFLFGESLSIVRIIQVLISTANIFLIYLITKNLFSKTAGYISASIAAIYGMFIFYSGLILSETLQVFFVSLLLYFLTKKERMDNFKWWFVIGILLGVAAIFRANILIFYFFVIIWIILTFRKNEKLKAILTKTVIYFTIGTALPILPITVRNYFVEKDFVMLTSNGGMNFYLGNNERCPGVFLSPTEFDFFNDLSGEKYAEKLLGKDLKPSEASNFWLNKGIIYITNSPVDAIKLTLKKLLLFFGSCENAQSFIMDYDFFQRESTLLKIPWLNFFFVSSFGLIGIFFLIKERINISLILGFIISYIIGFVIFFINGRFRLALIPILIVLAGIAIWKIFENIKTKNSAQLRIPILLFVAFALFNLFAVPKINYTPYDAYLSLGNLYFENKEYSLALENYKKSLSLSDNWLVNTALGNVYTALRDFPSAIKHLNKAVLQNPNVPTTFFNRGSLFTQAQQFDNALADFQKVIELDSQFAEAYRNIAIIHFVREENQKALEYFEKYLPFVVDERTRFTVIRDIETLKQKIAQSKDK